MIFVNRKIVKNYSFNTHAETILIMQNLIIRQLYFLSLSLALTVQLSALETGTPKRKLAPGKAAVWDLKALDHALSPRGAFSPAVSPPSSTGSAKTIDRTGFPPRYPKKQIARSNSGSGSDGSSSDKITRLRTTKV